MRPSLPSWASLREAGELIVGLLLVLAGACLLCALEVYWIKVCIDGLRKPACIRYCPPPRHILQGDPLHLESLHLDFGGLHDQTDFGDALFCNRCQKDFPDWDEDRFPFW